MKTDRERDAAIEQLLGGALRESAGSGDACPGSADLAAFVEGTLSPRERQTIEQHAAGCAGCLHALALMAESPLPMPDPEAGWRAWLSFARLSWMIPAAAAAAIVLYIAVTPVIAPLRMARVATPARPQPASVDPLASQAAQSRAQAAAPPVSAPVPPNTAGSYETAETSQQQAPATTAKPKVRATTVPSPAQLPGRVASTDAVQRAPVLDQVIPPAGEARQDQAVSQKAMNAPQAGTQVTEAPARAFDQLQTLQAQTARQAPGAAQTASRVTSTTAVFTEAAPRGSAEVGILPTAVVQAPGSPVRWRLDGDGRISRSQDGGVTWQEQQFRSASELLALSAPTPFTCWVAGRSGTIVLTTDGERWERRSFPEQVDLIAVDARDRRQAIVSTRDGRRFSTADGGNTWTLIGRR